MSKYKLIQINTVCNESTGKIMLTIQRAAELAGYQTLSIYGRRNAPDNVRTIKEGGFLSFWSHVLLTAVTGRHGQGSSSATRRIVKILRTEKPDIIHLHNLHGYYLNYEILFHYLKEEFTGRIFWTLHDCWAFTGHCAYYVIGDCMQWQTGCRKCVNRYRYPFSLMRDSCRENYLTKKETFCGVRNLTLLVPSQWLKNQVKLSFLKEYRTEITPNGTDLVLFRKREDAAAVRDRFGIPKEKRILLGVASHWDEGKGKKVFASIAQILPEQYCLVLVGAGLGQLGRFKNSSIILIDRTEDINELARLYSEAEVLINPSIQETFSMVTLEALACETPVIAADNSAVKELIPDDCGIVLHDPSPKDYLNAVSIVENRLRTGIISGSSLRKQAEKFPKERMAEMVLRLYKEAFE